MSADRTRTPATLSEAIASLREGGVVLFPTETVAGLGCAASHSEAVARLRALKGRAPAHPFPLLIPEGPMGETVVVFSQLARKLAARYWPGPLTLVLPAGPAASRSWVATDGTVGVRRSAHPTAAALVAALDHPVVATSANRTGSPAPHRVAEVDAAMKNEVDAWLPDVEGGAPPYGQGSTVVRVLPGLPPEVLRAGSLDPEEILALAEISA